MSRSDTDRGSVRARAVRRGCALTVRPLAALAPVDARTLQLARPVIDQMLRTAAPMLRGTQLEQLRMITADGKQIRGEWVRGPRVTDADRVVLYVHGGGFVAGSAAAYRGVVSRLSTATRMPVFSVDYRLAPEYPFPAAAQDVSAAYRQLLARVGSADRIVVAGDSAGGFLAAQLAIELARTGQAPPAALVLFSPMTDLSLSLAADHPGARREGLLSIPVSRKAIAQFTSDPLDLRPEPGMRLPPALIHTSDAEFFGADAAVLAQRWSATGAPCDLQIWPDQMHVFQALPALIPESRLAYRAAARFIRSVLPPEALAV
ncbi:alpha/beta hydrolase [Nocardia macrotermitis]|uniref:Acetyl esterase n=1 Tax=Nocardia macrotermitis TaxID=2585198 RepID=A0A7K0CVW6_9NOCA|nr:alpha/beta hydrolase [Nocardia macrotermitis]MQY17625.1 Acetyl esterase [Nocardia macrotermitis]